MIGPKPWLVICCFLVCYGGLLTQPPAMAASPLSVLPDDPRVAGLDSPDDFFGFPVGSRHLRHDQIVSYLKYLADHSDRVSLIPYGTTHGGRPLMVAAITSAQNHEQLDAIRGAHRRLSSGRTRTVPRDAHLVMYLGYNVHGDEASAANAAPIVASHSSARAIYDHPRNLDDERMRRLARKGGVLHMNALVLTCQLQTRFRLAKYAVSQRDRHRGQPKPF
jgi:hypothetical protein